MAYYERQLPHWHPDGAPLFVTWRLHGSLPAGTRFDSSVLPHGKAFVLVDRQLDCAQSGPQWLKDPRIAQLTVVALRYAQSNLKLYDLQTWVIMANHVHVLLLPHAPLSRITGTLKSFTGRKANQILGRPGQPFWQQESYDHWVRDRHEMEKIVRYIELNPVKAGLVEKPEDWLWSSARVG